MGYLEGFGVTIKKWLSPGSDSGRRVTTEYPEVVRPKPERFHGRHVLNRYDDGMEKCIGCELCAGVCPAKCIYVRGADNDPDAPTSPGERFGFIYEINYLRCIHCDLCVEACPTEAITESKLFEFAFTNRSDAIYTKAELVVGDDGRPQQLPWENWDGGYDPAELSSGWMRATAPGGDADFVGMVAWAGELGYGVRAPEGGGRVDAPAVAPPDEIDDGDDDHAHGALHGDDPGPVAPEPVSEHAPEPDSSADVEADSETAPVAAEPEPEPAPRRAGLFDAGGAAPAPEREIVPSDADAAAQEEPDAVPAPEDPVIAPEDPVTADPSVDEEGSSEHTDTTADRPARAEAPASGFFDLPDEPEPEPKDGGHRRRGWGRR